MKWLFGCLGLLGFSVLFLSLLIEVLPDLLELAVIFGAIWLGVKWLQNRKDTTQETAQMQQLTADKQSLEYKMEQLLTQAGYVDEGRTKREQYLHKETLNLRDYWYKFLDLRVNLALDGTPTHREEEVLLMMCNELHYRLASVEGEQELTPTVRKQFIEKHLAPLLHDIVDILEGIHPSETININAYELLKAAREEREPIRLTKER